jgi:hypothetical protein
MVRGIGLIAICSVLVSCGDDRDTTEPTLATEAPTTGVVPIVGVYESVDFYPACGTETLDHLGTTWFPIRSLDRDTLDSELQAEVDKVLAVPRVESPVAGVQGFARVVAPGPGDDTGTLVVWADGVARWVSDSRHLDEWMIDDEVTFGWVC